MNESGQSSPYQLSNPTVHLSITGDQSHGGQFSDDFSYEFPDAPKSEASNGVVTLVLSILLLVAGLYSWLA